MFKLVISTQDYENYGAHDWDGTGECPHRWKPKGGDDYICEVDLELASQGKQALEALVAHLSRFIVEKNDYYETYVIGWSLEEADWEPELKKQYEEYGDVYPDYRIDLLGRQYHNGEMILPYAPWQEAA